MKYRITALILMASLGASGPGLLTWADDAPDLEETEEIESFEGWSWKDKQKGEAEDAEETPATEEPAAPIEAPAVAEVPPAVEAAPLVEEIEDTAILDALATEPAEPPMARPLKPVRAAPASTIDAGRYEKLVKDNLDLRLERDALGGRLEGLKRENAQLNLQVREVESKRQEMATVLQELETAGQSTAAMQQKMTEIDAQRQRLKKERDALQVRARDLEDALIEAKTRSDTVQAQASPATDETMANVKKDSPLFLELQQEKNALETEKRALEKRAKALQDELEQLRQTGAREETEKVSAATSELRDRLEEEETRRLRDGQSKSEMERRVMKMQAQLDGLIRGIKGKDAKIDRQDKMLRAAAEELRRRDWRMDYAGKTMKTLNDASVDVRQSQNREMLNVHYNAGVLYTERGQFDAARLSYLRALAINPADSDVHYNLAILYEDHYKDSDKAYVHYKNYLQFNPQGDDADMVKSWLTEIELKIR
ncbi:MAG: tetratricopeptide repeat protein [Verrucomicrobia bacterium]|nr:tetratricopeptide repeat protein [Verrucomicrobiota bacterium]MDA1087926.1 tetratricopeptide repeat protein [Verrucomicrobiota bacterium]